MLITFPIPHWNYTQKPYRKHRNYIYLPFSFSFTYFSLSVSHTLMLDTNIARTVCINLNYYYFCVPSACIQYSVQDIFVVVASDILNCCCGFESVVVVAIWLWCMIFAQWNSFESKFYNLLNFLCMRLFFRSNSMSHM